MPAPFDLPSGYGPPITPFDQATLDKLLPYERTSAARSNGCQHHWALVAPQPVIQFPYSDNRSATPTAADLLRVNVDEDRKLDTLAQQVF